MKHRERGCVVLVERYKMAVLIIFMSHPIISLATIWLHRPVLTFIVVIRVFEDKDVIRPSPTPHCQHSKTEGKKKGKERERKNRKRALRRISLVIVVRQTNFWKLELIYPCWSAIVNEKQVFLCLFCCWWMVLNDPPRISVPTRKEV